MCLLKALDRIIEYFTKRNARPAHVLLLFKSAVERLVINCKVVCGPRDASFGSSFQSFGSSILARSADIFVRQVMWVQQQAHRELLHTERLESVDDLLQPSLVVDAYLAQSQIKGPVTVDNCVSV